MAAKKAAKKKRAKRQTKSPEKHGDSGSSRIRDEKGRILPGHTGNPNGRPRGYDIRRLAEDEAERRKVSLPEAIGRVVFALLEKAEQGDVQAAKLVIDKLCDSPDHIHVTYEGDVSLIHEQIPQDPVKLKDWVGKLKDMIDDDGPGKRRRA